MLKLLKKLLGIQALKIMVVNPTNVRAGNIRSVIKDLPIKIVLSQSIEDIKIIDTGIVVKKK